MYLKDSLLSDFLFVLFLFSIAGKIESEILDLAAIKLDFLFVFVNLVVEVAY